MNKPHQDTLLLEKLLDKYKFVRPVSGDVRDSILSSKKKNLVRVLKTVGAYSALHGVLLSLYFTVKKLGIGIPITKFIVSGIVVAAISYGGYYAVMTLNSSREEKAPSGMQPRSLDEVRAKYKWVDQITLYNGRIIEGAIISRGARYRVITPGGIIQIPGNQIKMVKPLRVETDTNTNQQKHTLPTTL